MKSRELLLTMKEFLIENLQEQYLSPESRGKKLRVFIHNLPKNLDLAESSYPFVIIRLNSCSTEEERCVDTLFLALGVYAPESQEQAGLLCAELADDIKIAFMSQGRLLASKFELELPFTCSQVEPKKDWNEYHMFTFELSFNYSIPSRKL